LRTPPLSEVEHQEKKHRRKIGERPVGGDHDYLGDTKRGAKKYIGREGNQEEGRKFLVSGIFEGTKRKSRSRAQTKKVHYYK